MTALGQHRGLDTGALSVSGLLRLLERLPAEARARITWSPTGMRAALTTFLDGAKDEAALRDLVAALVTQLHTIAPALGSLAAHPEILRAELAEAWRADIDALRERIDPPTADAADWIMRAWVAFIDLSLTVMHAVSTELPQVVAMADDEAIYAPGSPLRAQALMMAAIESARRDGDPTATSDLVFRAFDDVVKLLQDLQRVGVHIDLNRGETFAERAGRLRRYADHLRDALSDSDMHELELARMRALR